MRIGYLRVSIDEQRPDRQVDALQSMCDALYVEKLSAVADKRPVFDHVLSKLEKDDTLIVWDLDRAFRNTVDAILHLESLRERGITFEVVSLKVNTAEPAGEFAYSVLAAAAQYERRLLSKRTKEGLEAARKRGAVLGRRRKLTDRQVLKGLEKLEAGSHSLGEVASLLGVHPRTLSRAIKRLQVSET